MNAIKTTLLVALVGASSLAFADAPVTDTTRDQRMDQALQNYRGTASNNGTTRVERRDRGDGPAARAEEKMKYEGKRAGHAIGEAGRKTGHAIGEAGRKTGHAIHRGADKVTGKDEPK